jgi:hypothetical protein
MLGNTTKYLQKRKQRNVLCNHLENVQCLFNQHRKYLRMHSLVSVLVIHKPTPEMVTKLHNDKITYSFLPEFMIQIPQLPPPTTFISQFPIIPPPHQIPHEPGEIIQ